MIMFSKRQLMSKGWFSDISSIKRTGAPFLCASSTFPSPFEDTGYDCRAFFLLLQILRWYTERESESHLVNLPEGECVRYIILVVDQTSWVANSPLWNKKMLTAVKLSFLSFERKNRGQAYLKEECLYLPDVSEECITQLSSSALYSWTSGSKLACCFIRHSEASVLFEYWTAAEKQLSFSQWIRKMKEEETYTVCWL